MKTMFADSLAKAAAALCAVLITSTCLLVPRSSAKHADKFDRIAAPEALKGVAPTVRTSAYLKRTRTPENLLVNGSFEEGPKMGGESYLPLNKGSKDLKGWEVTRGQIDYEGPAWQHAHGHRSLDLNGSPGFGGIKQTFNTKKGRKYRLRFFMAGNPNGPVPVKTMAVEVAGKKSDYAFNTQGKTLVNMGWTSHTLDFTATDRQTTLEFYTLTQDAWCGPALDNVSVVAVPE